MLIVGGIRPKARGRSSTHKGCRSSLPTVINGFLRELRSERYFSVPKVCLIPLGIRFSDRKRWERELKGGRMGSAELTSSFFPSFFCSSSPSLRSVSRQLFIIIRSQSFSLRFGFVASPSSPSMASLHPPSPAPSRPSPKTSSSRCCTEPRPRLSTSSERCLQVEECGLGREISLVSSRKRREANRFGLG